MGARRCPGRASRTSSIISIISPSGSAGGHVGIGTDFDHGAGVTGFDSAAEAPNVTRELLRRGYSEKQVTAIRGGNFLRVLRAVEDAKKKAVTGGKLDSID